MLKHGQAEPVPPLSREGAGQESCLLCPQRPCPQHPAAPGCFRPGSGHPTGLSDAPKLLNPCSVPVLGRIPEPAAIIALHASLPALFSHSLCLKNLLGHNQLHSPGHKSWARCGCSVSSANLEFIEVFSSPPTGKKTPTNAQVSCNGGEALSRARGCSAGWRLQCCRGMWGVMTSVLALV